jgi:hypothetical protein
VVGGNRLRSSGGNNNCNQVIAMDGGGSPQHPDGGGGSPQPATGPEESNDSQRQPPSPRPSPSSSHAVPAAGGGDSDRENNGVSEDAGTGTHATIGDRRDNVDNDEEDLTVAMYTARVRRELQALAKQVESQHSGGHRSTLSKKFDNKDEYYYHNEENRPGGQYSREGAVLTWEILQHGISSFNNELQIGSNVAHDCIQQGMT